MKTRILAAVVLLPLLLILLLAAPKILTAFVVAVVCAIGAYELLRGTGSVKEPRLVIYSAVMAALTALYSYFAPSSLWMQLGILVFWVVLFVEIMISGMQISFVNAAVCFVGGVLIPYLLTAIVRIYIGEFGRCFVLIPFVLAFLPDSGAYFAGRAFGKHKLAPRISPKKTVEGVYGGILAAVVGMLIFCLVLDLFLDYQVNYFYAVIYGLVGTAAAVFGDLCFSVIKRQTGIKDYGNLIPGHGGILDRLDSMVIVAPVTEVLLSILPLAVKV